MAQPSIAREKHRCVLKRIRKGAYECGPYLVLYCRWINEKWDGPLESYRPWRVYSRASPLTPRAFVDSFKKRGEAHRFVRSKLVGH
jgi:hypothetical protein